MASAANRPPNRARAGRVEAATLAEAGVTRSRNRLAAAMLRARASGHSEKAMAVSTPTAAALARGQGEMTSSARHPSATPSRPEARGPAQRRVGEEWGRWGGCGWEQ